MCNMGGTHNQSMVSSFSSFSSSMSGKGTSLETRQVLDLNVGGQGTSGQGAEGTQTALDIAEDGFDTMSLMEQSFPWDEFGKQESGKPSANNDGL